MSANKFRIGVTLDYLVSWSNGASSSDFCGFYFKKCSMTQNRVVVNSTISGTRLLVRRRIAEGDVFCPAFSLIISILCEFIMALAP